jgi:polyphosphate:AMP phosphotransferase
MFEAAELGHEVSKQDFDRQEPELRTQLLAAQRELSAAKVPVILIVSGVEGAGKGAVVNRLNEWLDARGVVTHAFWTVTDEERERPPLWRFVRRLPERGQIGILFGSWYSEPIIDHALGQLDTGDLDQRLERIAELERMLTADGALVVKLWYHLSKKRQKKRLENKHKTWKSPSPAPFARDFAKHYDDFAATAEHAIRRTDTGECPWHVVEATDDRYRDLATGTILLEAFRHRLEGAQRESIAPPSHDVVIPEVPAANVSILDRVDVTQSLDDETYRDERRRLQARLNQLSWMAWKKGRSAVVVFEGWDAAGKGGAIRRMTAALDARLTRVIQSAAPSDEERAHHYLWRFWRHIPRAGHVTIYDRSWYGRVLVERVEGFATRDEWMRAYAEINHFEEALTDHGVAVLKFWIHISQEEQLRRFEERAATPHKAHKITEEDWRNREKWAAYESAVNDMVSRTSTAHAPWTLVAGNDKRFGRIQVLRTAVERLEEELD